MIAVPYTIVWQCGLTCHLGSLRSEVSAQFCFVEWLSFFSSSAGQECLSLTLVAVLVSQCIVFKKRFVYDALLIFKQDIYNKLTIYRIYTWMWGHGVSARELKCSLVNSLMNSQIEKNSKKIKGFFFCHKHRELSTFVQNFVEKNILKCSGQNNSTIQKTIFKSILEHLFCFLPWILEMFFLHENLKYAYNSSMFVAKKKKFVWFFLTILY